MKDEDMQPTKKDNIVALLVLILIIIGIYLSADYLLEGIVILSGLFEL